VVANPTYSGPVAAPASAPSAENAFATRLFQGLPPRYDLLAEILSFGQNGRWRRELVGHIAAARPRRILDVATGTAGVAIELARRTDAEVVGVDISEAMLARGRQRVEAAGLSRRINLGVARAEDLGFPDAAFDAVSFTYLLRYVDDPTATLSELGRVVRPGGVVASLDFFVPPGRAWRLAWRLYTRTALPVAGLALGGAPWWAVGRFLGPNIEAFYAHRPLEQIVKAWEAAGFVGVASQVMSLGGGIVMWGTKGDA
jgi:demethylmenaquinone methyltransferase / 2-methoxy-6-polyprenyl-1,4-benzoquinol methylase